jgi:hypothetical protein
MNETLSTLPVSYAFPPVCFIISEKFRTPTRNMDPGGRLPLAADHSLVDKLVHTMYLASLDIEKILSLYFSLIALYLLADREAENKITGTKGSRRPFKQETHG